LYRLAQPISVTTKTSPHLLTILSKLNQIGTAINQSQSDNLTDLKETLNFIVETATEVVPGSSAVIYTYNEKGGIFDISSRVASKQHDETQPDDAPRPNGMGITAVNKKQRILSYEMPDYEINPARADQGAIAVACYPLIVAEEILGALYVYLHESRAFNEIELLMLDNFVNLTAMTLAASKRVTQAQQDQLRKERELRRIRRAGRLISSRTSFKDTLDVILQMALEVTDAQYGIFRLVNKEGTHLIAHAFIGAQQGKPATEALPINDKSVMGNVAIQCEPLIISDLLEEPWKSLYYPLDRELVMRSELAVPLIGASGRLEGVLNLESPHVNAFSKQDRYILQILATQAVTALQEVRLLTVIQEVTAILLTEPIQTVHRSIVEKACDLLNAQNCILWLCEENQLVAKMALTSKITGWRINQKDSLIGKGMFEKKNSIILKANQDLPDNIGEATNYGPALIAPLFIPGMLNNKPIGVLSVYFSENSLRDFEQIDWDINVLNILGHYATLAIQSATHQEELRLAQERHTVIEAFAAIGEIASNLLHQLNNKIGSIPVRVEGIQGKRQSIIETDVYLRTNLLEIERSATEAIEIVRDSLFHLRPIQFSSVAVKDAVDTALSSSHFPEGIRIFRQKLSKLPKVHACPQRLPLVFSNLIDNASRVMQGQGEIHITGNRQENKVVIRITDTGPGIPLDIQDHIFELDYSTSGADQPGNLGFGLWWVKTLIARFGGLIYVESDGRSGTTFILELPIAEVEA
jgi:signal transduction histidine kinase/putative methionine-R-sulfoxide reductase with GAF domain